MDTNAVSGGRVEDFEDGSLADALGDGITLVEFYAEWCGACTAMEPVLDSLAASIDGRILTVDVEQHLEAAVEFGAQSTPTFVLFADEQPVKRIKGSLTKAELGALISEYEE